MGVYIKNMEMPRDCPLCPLAHYNRLDQFTGCDIVSGRRYAMQDETYAQSSVRPDWCPLIEIPEAKEVKQ